MNEINIVLNNLYLPANNAGRSTGQNVEDMIAPLSHLDALHKLTPSITDYIGIDDFNVDPNDTTKRANLVRGSCIANNYIDVNLAFHPLGEHSNESGRLIDRIVCSENVSNIINGIQIGHQYYNTDHLPVCANISYKKQHFSDRNASNEPSLEWNNASEAALLSYSRLTHLEGFLNGQLDGV